MSFDDDFYEETGEEPSFEDAGPKDGDWTTKDHVTFYQYGRPVLTLQKQTRPGSRYTRDAQEGELSDASMWKQIDAQMKKQGHFPGVWWVSDHGNAHLMTRPKRKNYRKAKREAEGATRAGKLIRAAERKYGAHGPLIAGGLRSHWPEPTKEAIRQAWSGRAPARRRSRR